MQLQFPKKTSTKKITPNKIVLADENSYDDPESERVKLSAVSVQKTFPR